MAAAHARDLITATAQAAARAEMVQGDWKYERWTRGLEMERFAERVLVRVSSCLSFFNIARMQRQQQQHLTLHLCMYVQERMASSVRSSVGDSSIVFTNYSITTVRLDPAATLAFAATQSQDPAMPPRQINRDGAGRLIEDDAGEAGRGIKATSTFTKVYGTDKPMPPPPAAPVDPRPVPVHRRLRACAADWSARLQPLLS